MYARTSTPRINQSTTTTRLYFPAKIKECIITKEKKKKEPPPFLSPLNSQIKI